MRRRDLLALLATLAAARPAAGAQQAALPTVGFLSTRSQEEAATHTEAFIKGLAESGFVEGRNIAFEFRWASGRAESLAMYAKELAGRQLAVLVAGGDPSAIAAKAAARSTPLAFMVGDDPVRLGLVASLNRPGGTATGVSLISSALGPKRLELLAELLPDARVIGLLVNPNNPNAKAHAEDVEAAATAIGRQLVVARARSDGEIEPAYAAMIERGARAMIVQNDPYFDSVRNRLIALAARHRLPAIYHIREFPAAGGLMSYGPSLSDAYHELGVQAARILRGAPPAELPVVRPSRFELLINLQVAAALGITVPPALTIRADAVIE